VTGVKEAHLEYYLAVYCLQSQKLGGSSRNDARRKYSTADRTGSFARDEVRNRLALNNAEFRTPQDTYRSLK
jgi:hypothetical protein